MNITCWLLKLFVAWLPMCAPREAQYCALRAAILTKSSNNTGIDDFSRLKKHQTRIK